jgi:Uri superfamily endonuclease
LVSLDRDCAITVGKLGRIDFRAGTYAYCGSAMAGYRGRVGRHFSRVKKLRWHIDYLIEVAEPVSAFLVAGGEGMECALGRLLSGLEGSLPVPGFGSSDCRCTSHLFWIEESSIPSLAEGIKSFSSGAGACPENH